LIYIIIAIVVFLLILLKVLIKKPKFPYILKGPLMTKTEFSFYSQLTQILPDNYLIFSKVRMWDVFDVKTEIKEKFTHQNKISSKHIDFVICDSNTNVVFCIELDDSSHLETNRKESDLFKNQLFEKNNLPLIRFKAQYNYKQDKIREQLMGYM
jgi:very-short-patch-repair endonuclease